MVIFTARQNLANLNEVKMNLIVIFANLAGKSYNNDNNNDYNSTYSALFPLPGEHSLLKAAYDTLS